MGDGVYTIELSQGPEVGEMPTSTGQDMGVNHATPGGSGTNPSISANKRNRRKKRSDIKYGFPTGTLMSSKASRLGALPEKDDRVAIGEFYTNFIEVKENPAALLLTQVPPQHLKGACLKL